MSAVSQFDLIQQADHEAVLYVSDKASGLRGYIAIHDTTLGPGLGGIRIKDYPSETAALEDVLALSEAMTYKSSCAGLDYGGAKSVIIVNSLDDKTPELLTAFARKINLLQGTYVSASDIGSTADDLNHMRTTCPEWVPGKSPEQGGLGDSYILTALGVYHGMRAAAKARLGNDDLSGLKVAIQGVGKVGFKLMEHLKEAGCSMIVSDTYAPALERVKELYPEAEVCTLDELNNKDVDIFSPNAIGGLLTESVANNLKASIVCGGANNPLDGQKVGQILKDRDILFAPDFVVNSGGVITLAYELSGGTMEQAVTHTEQNYERTLEIFNYAKDKDMLPWNAAVEVAMNRVNKAKEQRVKSVTTV